MARPTKQGIDYYSLDVNFLKDIKVRKIRRACGPQSIEILLCLLGNIYRENGYYIGWDEDTVFLVADEVGAKEGLVEEVVAKAIQSKFFDVKKFEQYKILTSNGIQKRYFEATAKRKGVDVKKEFLVNADNNPSPSVVNDDNNYRSSSINVVDNEQSKVKETKVNKSKSNHHDVSPLQLANNHWGKNRAMNSLLQDAILQWCNTWENELVAYALDLAYKNSVSMNGVKPYVNKILTNWKKDGIDSLEKAKAQSKPQSNQKAYSNKRVENLPEHIAHPMTEAEASEKARQELINLGVNIND